MDKEQPEKSAEGDRKSEWGEGTSEGAGASNRPMGEEGDNTAPVPERGVGTTDTTQGNG